MEDPFEEYLQLRDEIDSLSVRLYNEHRVHVKCCKGCASCCMDYSIFPIEFFYIEEQIRKLQLTVPESKCDDEPCIFLKDNICSIYDHRPVICRTHGLPLLYLNPDTEAWELSACDLNFTEFDDFDEQNTFPQDKYNSRLFMLNGKFIETLETNEYSKFDLLPIRNLCQKKH